MAEGSSTTANAGHKLPERAVVRPARLDRPHYVFRPLSLVGSRVRPRAGRTKLPWGVPLRYGTTGPMGSSLERTGVYDLAMTETIFRLVCDGDTALDGGANVGYVTSLMACRAAPSGTVIAFEPQPEVFARLEENVRAWEASGTPLARIELRQLALSSSPGDRVLNVPGDRDANHERASLREFKAAPADRIPVRAVRLDDIERPPGEVRVLKLDTERHEHEVLLGAERLLGDVLHVILEHHEVPPSPVSELLVEHGFELYTVHEGFAGPKLAVLDASAPHIGWGPPNLIGTRDAGGLRAAFAARGWQSLSPRLLGRRQPGR